MQGAVSWLVLIFIFMIAGGGINLVRLGIQYEHLWEVVLGIIIAALAITYLGGFIYYRDKKRGRVKRPDWLQSNHRDPRN